MSEPSGAVRRPSRRVVARARVLNRMRRGFTGAFVALVAKLALTER
jgi:hypothetical protein